MAEKRQISSLKTYLSSKESLWFWFSLAFIFAFFIFSWIISDNILILFIKRATTLTFAFILPGYIITKIIYPRKNEINVIERFAFSVAFSITFIMFVGYVLHHVWEITRFSFAVTTFLAMLSFAFIALLRDFNIRSQKSNGLVKLKDKIINVLPLLLLCILFFIIQSYSPITNFNIISWDPYAWTWNIVEIISTEHIDVNQWAFGKVYPIGFPLVTAFLSIFLDIRPYDAMRFIPIFSFLNIVPVYLLANHIFKSERISLLSGALFFSTRWMFSRSSIGHPETFVHFLLILSLLMLLRSIERPSVKNALITSLLLSSTVLQYHMPIQFLIVFLPSIFLFIFLHAHFNKKSKIKFHEMVKSAFFIGTPLIMLSGLLWYFWEIDNIFQRYIQRDTATLYLYQRREIIDYHFFNILNRVIFDIGWLQTIFSLLGLILLVQHPKLRGKFRYQFLVIYFFVLLLLSHANYFGVKLFHAKYMLVYLILPVSLLSSYGFLNILNLFSNSINRISKKSISTEHKFYLRKKPFSLIIVFMLLVNFNGFNYFWVHGESASNGFYKKELVNKLNNGEYSSLFFYKFKHGSMRKHIWNHSIYEYQAFKWLQENTPLNSTVIGWGSYDWTALRAISERDPVILYYEDTKDIPTSNLEQISKKIRYMRYFQGRDTYMVVGLKMASQFRDSRPPFSQELETSIAQDPNFKLVYENPQVKIYRPDFENYVVFLDRPDGFREDFEDLFDWGTDLNERTVLRTDGELATYKSTRTSQPIDIDFSKGLDTRLNPYFETRVKVDGGRIHIGVYDSTGKAHMFLKDYTTNGEWETYKFNLYDWLTRNRYETEIYGIEITNTLDGDSAFTSTFDWISIHNQIFHDSFEDESKIANVEGIVLADGRAKLSKKTVEILPNSGFENDFEGWRPRAKWSIDVEESHSGNKSAVLRGTAVDLENDPGILLDTEIYPGILKPNTTYRFSAWTRGNVTDAVRGAIRQYGSADPWSNWVYFTQRKNYDNWTYSEGIITMPGDVNGDFYVRIHGGGNPAVWIDDVSLTEDMYTSSGMLTSITTITENPIVSVTPTWSSVEPDKNTNITIEISVDNATTWTRAENGAAISYTINDANDRLAYRAFFQTNDNRKSPILHDITLVYKERLSNEHVE